MRDVISLPGAPSYDKTMVMDYMVCLSKLTCCYVLETIAENLL